MGNHMNELKRVSILVKGLEGMELLRRSSRLSVQPAPATEWKIINNLAEKKAAKKK
jgi:predicted RNA-binding protein with PUA-like domain